jgi:diguanylate cyclase (GGDEF)-like protein
MGARVSVVQRGIAGEPAEPPASVGPHQGLWSNRAAVVGYVLGVDALALGLGAVVVGLSGGVPGSRLDWLRFGALALACVVHIESSRHIERLREIAATASPYVHLKSMWMFAGVLLLPPPQALALAFAIHMYSWVRVSRDSPLYRKVFSAATVVVAGAAACGVVHLAGPHLRLGVPGDPVGLAALTVAAGLWWLINYALVVGAITLAAPQPLGRRAFGDLSAQLIVAGALGLGMAFAALLTLAPWLVVVLMVTVLALHRALLLPHLQAAAQTDGKTGLIDPTFWHQLAGKHLVRACRTGRRLGVLMIDLDHFKLINDRYGHLVGDRVLRALAIVLRSEFRGDDLIGRFGGEEFVVLLSDVGPAELVAAAERLLECVRTLEVPLTGDRAGSVRGLSVSAGGALYPDTADTLEELLLAADTALFEAKQGGRDQARLYRPVVPQEVRPH